MTNERGLNGNQLKLIAVVSMLLDHIGVVLADGELYDLLRILGRAAFPIYAFLLVEGFFHTGSWKKYALRLGVFAGMSECFYDLALTGHPVDWRCQNVFLTLLLGLLMMQVLSWLRSWMPGPAGLYMQLAVIIGFCGIAWLMKTDYSYSGIMLIAIFYWFYGDRRNSCMVGLLWMAVMETPMLRVLGLAAGFLMIYAYNGTRGRWNGRWFFYLFYPVHLMILELIAFLWI